MLRRGEIFDGGLDEMASGIHVLRRKRSQGTTMRNRFALAFALAFGFAAGAGPVLADDLFGAIAFSPSTGKVGGGWNFAATEEASLEAVAQCGVDDCEAVVSFPNCGAVAVGDGYGMGFSADATVEQSEATALLNCDGFTTNCLVTMSFCNEG